ncbi:WXG100 family type VII secretion target [Gordonia aquimaris]|uniref:WXG100 family type VII secretion target n=1 Tax=Gordonia aquimaris TaxID=2984863 RepID=A0A9X3D945_9ACTN|nr:WXG100 family type VII secretion target [Gordonia aquimaris]MCX2966304.1 WXG100 family type VII secretion target [Gordonia aquimaris]
MTDLEVDPTELAAARARIASWHGDCVEQFSRTGAVIGDSVSAGWSGTSGQAMARMASRWQTDHQRLVDRVHRHTEELRLAHDAFVQAEQNNSADLTPSTTDRPLKLD